MKTPLVTIRRDGFIVLNKLAHEMMGFPSRCDLVYHIPSGDLILYPEIEGELSMSPGTPSGERRVYAKKLIENLGIEKSIRCEPWHNEDHKNSIIVHVGE